MGDTTPNTDTLNVVTTTIAGNKSYSKVEGNINDLKDLAVEIRQLATDAGKDLSGGLNDALFDIEVQYQAYHSLDDDNFDAIH